MQSCTTADQPEYLCSLISAFVVDLKLNYIPSCLYAKFQTSGKSLQLIMLVISSEFRKTGFLMTGLIRQTEEKAMQWGDSDLCKYFLSFV